MIPLSALTTTEFRGAPTLITRFNGFTSALLTGVVKSGRSSGEMMAELDSLVRSRFHDEGVDLAYSGQSYQERTASGAAGAVLVLGLIIVFLVLASQYESWSLPFAVLLGVPFGVLGAYLGIWLRGQPSDVYVQIGLITVVGLSAKNAILIVEFARDLQKEGMKLREAAVEATRRRFRPIVMTSIAFILSVIPLMIAQGAGAASQQALGTVVFGGMLASTLLAIPFVPVFYIEMEGITERREARKKAAPIAHPTESSAAD